MNKVVQFVEARHFIPVDEWVPQIEDRIFKHTKDYVILPVSQCFGLELGSPIDYFSISSKRCYNDKDMREHCTHYINYFLKYYDVDKELVKIYSRTKYLIDFEQGYNKDAFLHDIYKYIFSPSLLYKITMMNRENYSLSLKYRNKKDPSLQYTNKHGSIMMKMSLMMNIIIPLLTHFISVKKISNSNHFLLEVFDHVLHMFDVDLYSKLYETSLTNVNKSKKNNPLWNKQDIRGINVTTHTLASINNIILNIMPKYNYNKNIINFNYQSIKYNIQFQVTDIGYEYVFIPLSSSKRDEDWFNSPIL